MCPKVSSGNRRVHCGLLVRKTEVTISRRIISVLTQVNRRIQGYYVASLRGGRTVAATSRFNVRSWLRGQPVDATPAAGFFGRRATLIRYLQRLLELGDNPSLILRR
jgi:hypothetical protein